MNVQEFQNKLKEVQEIARQHGNALNAAEIRQVFEECDLDKSQLLGVLKYLTSQGILIEGLETAGEEAKEPEHKKIPLTAEEDMAVEMNIEEMQLADLIQEANLCLIQALGTAGDECRDEKWLLSEMRKGIQLVLEEQTQRKFEDDSLVARVEKLESAVRELNDGEDEKNAFTIDELAIILDMKVDEIRDILRLTGDDN